MQETEEMRVPFLDQEDPLEEDTATHSSILAWRTPGTEEPGRLPSIVLQSQTRLKRLSTHTFDRTVPWYKTVNRSSPILLPCL